MVLRKFGAVSLKPLIVKNITYQWMLLDLPVPRHPTVSHFSVCVCVFVCERLLPERNWFSQFGSKIRLSSQKNKTDCFNLFL